MIDLTKFNLNEILANSKSILIGLGILFILAYFPKNSKKTEIGFFLGIGLIAVAYFENVLNFLKNTPLVPLVDKLKELALFVSEGTSVSNGLMFGLFIILIIGLFSYWLIVEEKVFN